MKRNRYQRTCLIAFALLIAGAVLAAPAIALKVEGARIALDVAPGETYTSTIGISISSEESGGTFAIDVGGFGQSATDGTYSALDAADDTSPYSARPFIAIDTPTVTLRPGERVEVTATISVPAGTQDGGRYAIILVHPDSTSSGAPAAFATAVAIPVFLTVTGGTITEAGEITAVEPIAAEPGTSIRVVTTFRNSGNYHYYSVVNRVTVTDAQGSVVATVKTDPFSRAIIPGQSVEFANSIDSGLPRGTYQVTSRVEEQDGTLLAEKESTLQVGDQATSTRSSPGFGVPAATGGMLLVLLYVLRSGKGGTG